MQFYEEILITLTCHLASDSSESHYLDMWRVVEKPHTPILKQVLKDLGVLVEDREWEVDVIPLFVG